MKKLFGMLAGTTLLAMAGSAQAATFNYGSFNLVDPQGINITSPNAISGNMGEFILHGINANAGQDLLAWCIDIYDHTKNVALMTITPLTTAGAGGGAPNPALTQQQIGAMGSLMIHGSQLSQTASDHNTSAAFQLAIWKTEYTNFAFTGVSAATIALANTFLANVADGGIWECDTCTVSQLDSGYGNQTLAFGNVGPGQEQFTTPLPAAVWLFGGGLGLIAMFGQRKRKQKSVWETTTTA